MVYFSEDLCVVVPSCRQQGFQGECFYSLSIPPPFGRLPVPACQVPLLRGKANAPCA